MNGSNEPAPPLHMFKFVEGVPNEVKYGNKSFTSVNMCSHMLKVMLGVIHHMYWVKIGENFSVADQFGVYIALMN